jgi:hypothetical protein
MPTTTKPAVVRNSDCCSAIGSSMFARICGAMTNARASTAVAAP